MSRRAPGDAVEYHLVLADGSASLAVFDRWGEPVRRAWERAAAKQSVNLLCLWPCGCVKRAYVEARIKLVRIKKRKPGGPVWREEMVRRHKGWRLVETCAEHARKKKVGEDGSSDRSGSVPREGADPGGGEREGAPQQLAPGSDTEEA